MKQKKLSFYHLYPKRLENTHTHTGSKNMGWNITYEVSERCIKINLGIYNDNDYIAMRGTIILKTFIPTLSAGFWNRFFYTLSSPNVLWWFHNNRKHILNILHECEIVSRYLVDIQLQCYKNRRFHSRIFVLNLYAQVWCLIISFVIYRLHRKPFGTLITVALFSV